MGIKYDREGNFEGFWLDVKVDEVGEEGRVEIVPKTIYLDRSELRNLKQALENIDVI